MPRLLHILTNIFQQSPLTDSFVNNTRTMAEVYSDDEGMSPSPGAEGEAMRWTDRPNTRQSAATTEKPRYREMSSDDDDWKEEVRGPARAGCWLRVPRRGRRGCSMADGRLGHRTPRRTDTRRPVLFGLHRCAGVLGCWRRLLGVRPLFAGCVFQSAPPMQPSGAAIFRQTDGAARRGREGRGSDRGGARAAARRAQGRGCTPAFARTEADQYNTVSSGDDESWVPPASMSADDVAAHHYLAQQYAQTNRYLGNYALPPMIPAGTPRDISEFAGRRVAASGDGAFEYLTACKGRSWLQAEWLSAPQIEAEWGRPGDLRRKRYDNKVEKGNRGLAAVPEEWLTVDRVVRIHQAPVRPDASQDEVDGAPSYCVKWRGRAYDELTWETRATVLAQGGKRELERCEQLNSLDGDSVLVQQTQPRPTRAEGYTEWTESPKNLFLREAGGGGQVCICAAICAVPAFRR